MTTGSTLNSSAITVGAEHASQALPLADRSPSAPPDRSIYAGAAAELLERWLSAAHPAPWLADQYGPERGGDPVRALYRDVSTAAAVGLYCRLRPDPEAPDRWFEQVRCSLLRWQEFLLNDGRPARVDGRRDPLSRVMLAQVVCLLSETSRFHTPLLLADVERCARWIARGPQQAPWIESAVVCALAEAAPLVRDASFLSLAQRRMEPLLESQDEDGWFADPTGSTLGRHSLTIDSLARLHSLTGWTRLEGPLRRAVEVLRRFVDVDAPDAACCGASQSAVISPYGVELLAGVHDDANFLARRLRERLAAGAWRRLLSHDDGTVTTLGVSLCLAGLHARATLRPTVESPNASSGLTSSLPAGRAIFRNEAYRAEVDGAAGGAVHVRWSRGGPCLVDPGAVICRARVSSPAPYFIRPGEVNITGNTITCAATISLPPPVVRRAMETARNWIGWGVPAGGLRPAHRRADRIVRRIEFLDDRVAIRDEVHCYDACESLVCQSPRPASDRLPLGPAIDRASRRPPIYIDGGREVQVERVYRNGELIDLRVSRDDRATEIAPLRSGASR